MHDPGKPLSFLDGLRPVLMVLLAVLFMEAGLGILSPLVYTLLARQEVPALLIGAVNSAYHVAFLIGTLTCHRAIDRVGHARAFTVFAAVAANAAAAHIVLTSPIAWVVLHAVVGYALAGLSVIVESWLNDKATEDNRGSIFGVYMAASWAASGLGPLALNYQETVGAVVLFTIVTGMLITALVPMSLTVVGNPDIEEREHLPLVKLAAASPTGVVTCFAVGLASSAYYGLLPAYAASTGLSNAQLAWLLSGATVAGFAMQFPIGWLSDHIGRRPLILASAASSGALALAVALLPFGSYAALFWVLILLSALMAPLYALGVGQTNDYITKDQFVAASAGLLFIWALGATAGPLAAGTLMDQVGALSLFWYLGLCQLALALFTLLRMTLRRAPSAEAQGNYVPAPMPDITHGAPGLDPRAEHPKPPRKKPADG
ncbi:MAG: MFS transporter [Hyphomicrobiaceae bacterium]